MFRTRPGAHRRGGPFVGGCFLPGREVVVMHTPSRAARRTALGVEQLEPRLVLSGPDTLEVPLDPLLDQFGDQVVTVQAYGDPIRTGFSIFDTGASAVTFSADDQDLFAFNSSPIPVKVPGGALAEGIGGAITGDV